MDPGKNVDAVVRYEVKVMNGPFTLRFRSEEIKVSSGFDLAVVVRITAIFGKIIDHTVVAIIGSEWRDDSTEFLNLRAFLAGGGVIGLNRDLL